MIPAMSLASAAILWLVAAIALAAPIATAESLAHDADVDAANSVKSHDRRSLITAADEMAHAFRVVPYNSDYARRAADLLLAAGPDRESLVRARQLLDAAVAADPSSVQNLSQRAQLELGNSSQVSDGLQDYRRALTLDPKNVRMRLDFARELLRAGKSQRQPNIAGEASLQFDMALDDNAQLPAEEIKRLAPKEVSEVERQKADAEKFAAGGGH
jgi:hypothetical protein